MRMFKRPPADESNDDLRPGGGRRPKPGRDDRRRGCCDRAGPGHSWWRGAGTTRRRAFATLLGLAVAGFLAWLTTRIGDGTNGKYWAEYGILAGAGLAIAISQLVGGLDEVGRPRFSPSVFLLAFVPTLIAVGWILGFHQPGSNWLRSHTVNWSGDLGIADVVTGHGRVADDAVVRARAGLRAVLRHDGRPRRGDGARRRRGGRGARGLGAAHARARGRPLLDSPSREPPPAPAGGSLRSRDRRRSGASTDPYSMTPHGQGRGTAGLLAHVQALRVGRRTLPPPRARLSDRLGPGLADLLVHALAGDQGMRRRARRA